MRDDPPAPAARTVDAGPDGPDRGTGDLPAMNRTRGSDAERRAAAAGPVGAAGEAAPRAEEPETIEGAVRADRSLVTGAPRPTEPEDR